MKKFVLLFGCVCFCLSVFAQTNFQDISFSEALKKAKEENKMVFVDCYTSWCGPCKYMADKVFPQKKLGKYLNDRFVSLKINAEQGEGVDIASKYSVSAYPTFLILKTDGTLIYRIVGGTEGADEFISKVEEGFGEKSAFRMEERYLKGDREEGYLFVFLKSLLASGLDEKAREVAGEIFRFIGCIAGSEASPFTGFIFAIINGAYYRIERPSAFRTDKSLGSHSGTSDITAD